MSSIPPLVLAEIDAVRERVASFGYALTSDSALGFEPGLRDHLVRTYFVPGVLHNDGKDIPADRERARDVVRYEWGCGDVPDLEEHAAITLGARGSLPGDREYCRVPLLGDGPVKAMIERMLSLVPEGERWKRGTFGVNLFRTHTNVVTEPHKDMEHFVLIYVLDKCGTGAETTLFPLNPEAEPVERVLNPGDLIIFRDADFLHTASPIIPPDSGERPRRDALICTVDYPETYGVGE